MATPGKLKWTDAMDSHIDMLLVHRRLLAMTCVRHDYTEGFAQEILSWSEEQERENAPPNQAEKLCRLTDVVYRIFKNHFLGVLVQICLPLMDQINMQNNAVKGRLHIPPTTSLFGEGYFNHSAGIPWATIT